MPLPGGRACAARQAASKRQCLHSSSGRAGCTVVQAQGAISDPGGGGGGGGRVLAGGVGGWVQDPGQVGWVGGGPNHQCKEHTKQHSRVPKL